MGLWQPSKDPKGLGPSKSRFWSIFDEKHQKIIKKSPKSDFLTKNSKFPGVPPGKVKNRLFRIHFDRVIFRVFSCFARIGVDFWLFWPKSSKMAFFIKNGSFHWKSMIFVITHCLHSRLDLAMWSFGWWFAMKGSTSWFWWQKNGFLRVLPLQMGYNGLSKTPKKDPKTPQNDPQKDLFG